MRSIAVINQKGGSGKTTMAVNLAAGLARLERNVLLIDLDAQASASLWYGFEEDSKRGLLDVLVKKRSITELIRPTSIEKIAMIPASNWLMTTDRLLAAEPAAETRLRDSLQDVSLVRFDYLLIDCPPTLGLLTVNALAAVSQVLIPVEAHVLPLHGLRQLLETIELVRRRLNSGLAICGIAACRVDGRTRLSREVLADLRDRFGDMVYRTTIRENVRLAECPSFGKSIFEYAPRSHGAQDFHALAEEVLEQERKKQNG